MIRFLFDTNVFLWLAAEPERFSAAVRAVIEHDDSALALSIASLWEITIKAAKNPSAFLLPLDILLADTTEAFALISLPITNDHLRTLATLPHHHGDPFDRMIVAQALTERVPLLTADRQLSRYGVEVIA